MKTVGEYLRHARRKNKYSFTQVSKDTKIKREFLRYIEKEEWEKLPEYPVVLGFVKKLAQSLDLNQESTLALLRRDYPPKSLPLNPKPDVSSPFLWSPRLTFISAVIVAIFIITSYLALQYFRFISPPKLLIDKPEEGMVVVQNKVKVVGRAEPDVSVNINNQPVLLNENGEFEAEIEITKDTKEIEIKAISRSGKETVVKRRISPSFD